MSNLSKATEIYLYLIKHPETKELERKDFAEFCYLTGSWGFSWRKWEFSFVGEEDIEYDVRFVYDFSGSPVEKDFSISYFDQQEVMWRWLILPLSSELHRTINK